MNHEVNKIEEINVVRGDFRRGTLARITDQIKAWNERRVAIRQLRSLSDRMLSDIGIDRFQIASAVTQRGSFAPIGELKTRQPSKPAIIKKAA